MSEETKISIDIHKIYISDLSVEVPNSPDIFQQELNPEISMQVGHEISNLPPENYHNVKLRVRISAKDGENNIYLIEVSQNGIFEIVGLNSEQLEHALNVFCTTTLYPYARESISNAIVNAGFPPLYIQPVNFDALYQQKLNERANSDNK